ncbi:MAG: hypothetical protein ACP5GE_05105, partial [Thermoplasmata archaeon]
EKKVELDFKVKNDGLLHVDSTYDSACPTGKCELS